MQGREDELEKLNRDALSIARRVANKYDKLLAGGLSNTPLYSKDDKDSHQKIYEMFKVTTHEISKILLYNVATLENYNSDLTRNQSFTAIFSFKTPDCISVTLS
jgi:methionine synthase I (cobalamin-dependent)